MELVFRTDRSSSFRKIKRLAMYISDAPKPIRMQRSRLYPRSRRYRILEKNGVFRPQERQRKYRDLRRFLPIYHWVSCDESFIHKENAQLHIDEVIRITYDILKPTETIHPYYPLSQHE